MKKIIFCILLIPSLLLLKSCDSPTVSEPEIALTSTDLFLSVSDVHLNHLWENTKFGWGNDSGNALWHRTKLEIEKLSKTKKPKFMVYLGDLPHHENSERSTNVGIMLKNLRALQLGIPILYLPGNNDSPGGDYHSFTDIENGKDITPFSTDPNTSDPWPILHEQSKTAQITNVDYNDDFGFYSCKVNMKPSSLHVIALNSVIFCHGQHKYQNDDGVPQDSAARLQFDWFAKKMDSYTNTDKVMIMMHIPPGMDGHTNSQGYNSKMWNEYLKYEYTPGNYISIQSAFLKEMKDHSSQITGVLTSHTHFDGLRRLNVTDSSGNPSMVGLSISTPGITIGHGNNPGFKFFKFNNKTLDLVDFETHYAVPTATTKYANSPDSLFVYQGGSYTFQEIYGGSHPKPNASIQSVINKMSSSTLINNMQQIIAVKSDQGYGNFNFTKAMDVYPD